MHLFRLSAKALSIAFLLSGSRRYPTIVKQHERKEELNTCACRDTKPMPRVSAHVAGWDLSLRLGCSGIRTLLIPSQICQSSVSLLEWCFWPSLVSFRQVAFTSATRPHNFKTIMSRCPRGGSLAIPRRRARQHLRQSDRSQCRSLPMFGGDIEPTPISAIAYAMLARDYWSVPATSTSSDNNRQKHTM